MSSYPPDEIRRELSSREKVLWLGQPRQGNALRGADIFLVPFSLLWGGFAFFWEAMALRASDSWFMAIWGVPFVLVGVYIIAGRFLVDAWQRARTFYAVTGERVIIVSGLFSPSVQSFNLRTLGELSLSERRGGEGSITFGRLSMYERMYGGMRWWPGMLDVPCFDLIPDARSVYETVRNSQRTAESR